MHAHKWKSGFTDVASRLSAGLRLGVRREQLPVVVFCFSKRRCDSLVDSLASLDMTSADDKSDIQVACLARS